MTKSAIDFLRLVMQYGKLESRLWSKSDLKLLTKIEINGMYLNSFVVWLQDLDGLLQTYPIP